MLHLILGGARSGKSRLAESLATDAQMNGQDIYYVATTDSALNDQEMAQRIEQHRQQRPASWTVIEAPRDLSQTLLRLNKKNTVILVDCLTLWLSNCLLTQEPDYWEVEKNKFLALLPKLRATLILVSNEVGQGLVSMDPLARKFVDESGWLHQDLSKLCDKVSFVTAGLTQTLKDSSLPPLHDQ